MSEHAVTSPEVTFAHPPAEGTGRIWKIFWLLSAITVVELALGFGLAKHWYGDPETSHTAILFVKGGQVVDKLVGAQPKSNFVKKIEQHK